MSFAKLYFFPSSCFPIPKLSSQSFSIVIGLNQYECAIHSLTSVLLYRAVYVINHNFMCVTAMVLVVYLFPSKIFCFGLFTFFCYTLQHLHSRKARQTLNPKQQPKTQIYFVKQPNLFSFQKNNPSLFFVVCLFIDTTNLKTKAFKSVFHQLNPKKI